MALPTIDSVFVGGPKTITDAEGTWVSSICREPILYPVDVLPGGLAGDRVAQPYHGGLDAAVCAHLLDHYRYWNQRFGMDLKAGMVGENVTLDGIAEDQICAGDVVRAGTVTLQVSGPRIPCANLARRIGRPDWARLTLEANRTGFYLRVLKTGKLRRGDSWELLERLTPDATITAINRCMFLSFDPAFAAQMQSMAGLGAWWKQYAQRKLDAFHAATEKAPPQDDALVGQVSD